MAAIKISEATWERVEEYYLEFPGFMFECDKNGVVDETLPPEAMPNWEAVKASGLVGEVVDYSRDVRVPAVYRCPCGHEFAPAGYDEECRCGRLYNGCGQELRRLDALESALESKNDWDYENENVGRF